MGPCSSCGAETDNNKKTCPSCLQQKLDGTWKRQMRNYSMLVGIGTILMVFSIYQVRHMPHSSGMSEMPLSIIGEAAIGGLGLLGGLFGLALAMFFGVWHKKRVD